MKTALYTIIGACVSLAFYISWPIKPSKYEITLPDDPTESYQKFSRSTNPRKPLVLQESFRPSVKWVQTGQITSAHLFGHYWIMTEWRGEVEPIGEHVFGRIFKHKE